MLKRPLLLPVLLFFAGVILAALMAFWQVQISFKCISASLFLSAISLIISIRFNNVFRVCLCVFFFMLGFARCASGVFPAPNDMIRYLGNEASQAVVYGTVITAPEPAEGRYSPYFRFKLDTKRMVKDGNEFPVSGIVDASLFESKVQPELGDKVVLSGKISKYRGNFRSNGSFTARRPGASIIAQGAPGCFIASDEKTLSINALSYIYDMRDKADKVLRQYLTPPASYLLESVTLGKRSGLSVEDNDVFQRTGTIHILSVSGLHMSVAAAVILVLLRLFRVPFKLTYFGTILGLAFLAVFTGGSAPAVRSALMGALLVLSIVAGRKTEILNTIILSAFLIIYFSSELLFNAGFILSYGSVLSMLYVTPFTDKFVGIESIKGKQFGENKIIRFLRKTFSVSLAVWLGIMPSVAWFFSLVTPSALVANFVAVPVISIILILGYLLITVGSFPILALVPKAIGFIVSGLTFFLLGTLKGLSLLPLACLAIPAPPALSVIFYYVAGIAAALVFGKKRPKMVVIFLLLLGANIFVWTEVSRLPPKDPRVTFFDTAKSDAFLFEMPDGSTVLIDGGTGGAEGGRDMGRYVVAQYLTQHGIRRIDCIFISHSHEDHTGGLKYILNNFGVGTIISGTDLALEYSGEIIDAFDGAKLRPLGRGHERRSASTPSMPRSLAWGSRGVDNIIKHRKIKHFSAKRGDILKLNDLQFYILNPPGEAYGDANDDSLVIKAVTEKGSVLFCGDAGPQAMRDMMLYGGLLKSDIVKVPHHGQYQDDIRDTIMFLEETGCDSVVITNRTGVKKVERLTENLKARGIEVFVTGELGDLVAEETE